MRSALAWIAVACLAPACRRSSLHPIEIADPKAHWAGGGFAEMVPAIRLPTSRDGSDRITNWLRVPDGTRIGVRRLDDGRAVPSYPRGTIADRVELVESALAPEDQHAWSVIDVRGTRIDDDGVEQFHCLQPTGGGALAGFEWARDDEAAERAATDGLVDIIARARLDDDDAPAPGLARFRRFAHCQTCHDHDRRERTQVSERGPRRATDDAGFYSMLSVLADAGPLEDHRPRDLNADDPFMTLSRPADGTAPRARLDFARALASGRPHEAAVCRSRRYLFDHMDDEARRGFADAFTECGIR